MTVLGEDLLNEWRTGKNTQHTMVALMQQSIFSQLGGYEDTDDAEGSQSPEKQLTLAVRKQSNGKSPLNNLVDLGWQMCRKCRQPKS